MARARRLHLANDFPQAESIYRALLAAEPGHVPALCLLADVLGRTGRNDEALTLIRRALELAPASAETHAALGHEWRRQREWQQAERAYRDATRLRPGSAEHLNDLGVVLAEQGRARDAEDVFRAAVDANPGCVPAHSNLGTSLHMQGRLAESEQASREALRRHVNWADAHSNLGVTLGELGRYDEAIFHLQRAIDLKPGVARGHYNLANVYRDRGWIAEAYAANNAALALDAGAVETRWNGALLELLRGDWPRGFRSYESRWDRAGHFSPWRPRWRKSDKPRWDGADPAGRTILLQVEQGLGDTLQFVRYAPMLARQGARVLIEAQPELARLLRGMPALSGLVDMDGALPEFDCACPLLSLPRLFGTTVADVPAAIPYLAPDPHLAGLWRRRVEGGPPGPRVGVAWAGNRTHKDDRKRSIDLAAFAPLARVDGVAWYSLQKGDAAGQAARAIGGMQMVDLTPELGDFADTAALLMSLDLVIAVDTAVAHLAGALGRPVWLLLPFVPDWRWLLEREDTPWYPTMRLFRQQRLGDWTGVMEDVAEALRAEFAREPRDAAPRAGDARPAEKSSAEDERLALALRHLRERRIGAAAALCEQVLRAVPDNAYALHLAGAIAHAAGDHAGACERIESAIELNARVAMFHNTLGNARRALGHSGRAVAAYRAALRLRSGYAEAHNNLGNALRELGLIEQAMLHYDAAVRLDPGNVEVRLNAARASLLAGDLERGFRDYEWRWRQPRFLEHHPPLPGLRWGGEDVAGRCVLLRGEQGAGHTLQFIRYAPLVAARGARVMVECQPELKRLLAATEGVAGVYARGEPLPPYDCWCPIPSLPSAFGTTLEAVPSRTPYLRVAPDLVARWRERLAPLGGAFKVGIAWAGSAGPGGDSARPLRLAALSPLARATNAALVSLQKGAAAAQAADAPGGMRIVDYGGALTDVADAAALIVNLDLVITADTALAHLAGALARPAWVLLPYVPDWPWMTGRADSPWYPGMRLLRQIRPGIWDEPVERAACLLTGPSPENA